MGYIEKLEQDFKDGKISKEEFTKSKVDYYKNWGGGNLEELEKELKETKSIKEDKAKKNSLDDNLNKESKEVKNNSAMFWGLSFFTWLLTSFMLGASDTIQIFINILAPATFAIVPTLMISIFTKKFSGVTLLVISLLILFSTLFTNIMLG